MLSVNRDELARQFQADFETVSGQWHKAAQKEALNSNETSQRDALQNWLSETPQSLHQEVGFNASQQFAFQQTRQR